MHKLFYVVFIILFLSVNLSYAKNHKATTNNNYLVIVDAGSSGNRFYLFKYIKTSDLPLIKQIYYVDTGFNTAISQYTGNIKTISTLYQKSLFKIRKFLSLSDPSFNPKHLAIYVYATAGMRKLQDKNLQLYNIMMSSIANLIKEDFKLGYVGVLNNIKEGIFGWIAVNYAHGMLYGVDSSLGAVDMGSKAIQLTIPINKNYSYKSSNNIYKLHLGKKEYLLYSQTIDNLANKSITKKIDMRNYCFAKNSFLEQREDFSYLACFNSIANHFYNLGNIEDNIKNQIFNTRMVAYSDFYYIANFFDVNNTKYPLKSLAKNVKKICTNNELFNIVGLKQHELMHCEEAVKTYCFRAVYINYLLTQYYGISHRVTSENLIIVDKVDDFTINWPLGAVTYLLMLNAQIFK